MEDELFTSVVRLRGSKFHVVPVKSSKPVPHNKWIEFSKILSRLCWGSNKNR